METQSETRWTRSWTCLIIVFVLSAIIFASRNLDPFTFPTLYAEDGSWTGAIMKNGVLETAFRIREFPVLGLVAMLKAGLVIVDLLFESDISYLPRVLFVISLIFLASLATLTFAAFSTSLPLRARIVMWLAIVLMPVGEDGNEIFGRILNLGFLFPVFQYILLAKIVEGKQDWQSIGAAAAFSLVAGWTFPVSIVFTVIALFFLVNDWWRMGRLLESSALRAGLILAVVAVCNIAALSVSSVTSKGGANLPFSKTGLIEFVFARTWMYPLVARWYGALSNSVVLAAGTGSLAITFWAFARCVYGRWDNKSRHIFFIATTFAAYYFGTVVMRSGFTSLYGSYSTSFPDRYYYGLNIMVIFLWVMLLTAFPAKSFVMTTQFKNAIYIALAMVLLATAPRQLEWNKPKMIWGGLGTFEYSLCAHALNKGPLHYGSTEGITTLPIYPLLPNYPWRMEVPVEKLAAFNEKRCALVLSTLRKQPR